MIPAGPAALQHAVQQTAPAPNWRQAWRDAVRDPRELLAMLGLDALAAGISDAAAAQFPLRVPRGFVARMRHGDRHDPLLRQVLPVLDEDRIVAGFGLDAVGDAAARRGGGVIHKYNGRALLVATGSCAVHCRYCFRRHYPYAEDTAAAAGWREAVALVAGDASIHEVILSGGDPLSLADHKLAELTEALQGIAHIRRLRIHTRLPIVLPERVGDIAQRCPDGLVKFLGVRHSPRHIGVVEVKQLQQEFRLARIQGRKIHREQAAVHPLFALEQASHVEIARSHVRMNAVLEKNLWQVCESRPVQHAIEPESKVVNDVQVGVVADAVPFDKLPSPQG